MPSKVEWAKRVEAWRASGKSAREFCEGRDYSAKRLQWWGWRLNGASGSGRGRPVGFARVVQKRETRAVTVPRSPIVVHVAGARVEVSEAADRATLAALLDVLLATERGRA